MKLVELKKIALIYDKIEEEKEIQMRLNNSDVIINRIKVCTQKKLTRIKIDVFNIEYTLTEICKL